ncbi:MAG: flavodoxin [Tissierellia bacterium]|nr:flavodoxin [Tissierellia bacterium]
MKKVFVIYWSGTGNTEIMAKAVAEGVGDGAVLKSVDSASVEDVASCDALALGCPSMGDEVLEEEVMEPFVESIKDVVKGKNVALFGSYGWGNGQWMRDWQERMEGYGANVDEPVIAMGAPNDYLEGQLRDLGAGLA